MPCWTTSHNFFKAARTLTCFSISSIAISPLQFIVKSSSPPSAAIFGQSGLEAYLTFSAVQSWPHWVQWPYVSINIYERMHAYCASVRRVRRPGWGCAVDWFLQEKMQCSRLHARLALSSRTVPSIKMIQMQYNTHVQTPTECQTCMHICSEHIFLRDLFDLLHVTALLKHYST